MEPVKIKPVQAFNLKACFPEVTHVVFLVPCTVLNTVSGQCDIQRYNTPL